MLDELKQNCKERGLRCSIRNRNGRFYATISYKQEPEQPGAWIMDFTSAVKFYFPRASMTSGSASGATFLLATVTDTLKS